MGSEIISANGFNGASLRTAALEERPQLSGLEAGGKYTNESLNCFNWSYLSQQFKRLKLTQVIPILCHREELKLIAALQSAQGKKAEG